MSGSNIGTANCLHSGGQAVKSHHAQGLDYSKVPKERSLVECSGTLGLSVVLGLWPHQTHLCLSFHEVMSVLCLYPARTAVLLNSGPTDSCLITSASCISKHSHILSSQGLRTSPCGTQTNPQQHLQAAHSLPISQRNKLEQGEENYSSL